MPTKNDNCADVARSDKPIKMLLVEDDPSYASLIGRMLSDGNGFGIETADRLDKAIALLQEKKFDVLLSDLGLPDSSGDDTFRSLYEQAPDTPIVLLTGLDDESFALRLIKEGAQDYLVKDKIDRDLLVRAIRYSMERCGMLEKIRCLTIEDDLTGLYNRRGFETLAEKQIKLAERLEVSMLLYYVDVDKLKWINDNLGHDEGSFVIKKTAEILKETFRESDIIARVGGDEFVVLLLEKSGLTDEILNSRLQDNMDAYNAMSKKPYQISISAGVARRRVDKPTSIDEMLKTADERMYEKKRQKKGD